MKFQGDAATLWRRIDKDMSGTMTLSELAPKSSDELADFKHWARQTFGGMKEALIAMDRDHNGKLNMTEFTRACADHGFACRHLKLVFQCMDTDGAGTIESNEVKWLDKWDPPSFLYYEKDAAMWEKMKALVIEKNRNNAILAWRKALDKDSSMRMNYDEFLKAVKRLKLDPATFVPGAMWRAVDRNLSGWVSLREFDQRSFELLGGLRCWSLAIFGSVSNMFHAIDSNGGGDVSWKEFSAKLVEFAEKFDIILSEEDVLYMFNGLDLDGQKRLTIDELEFLEKWDLALDLEEEHVFPVFRLWSTGDETKEMVKQALHIDEQRRAKAEARENEQWKREGMEIRPRKSTSQIDDFDHVTAQPATFGVPESR